MFRFADRVDAGRRLAQQLLHLRGCHVIVVGLPRGGVPVAAEVAAALDAPLDLILVRKLGFPGQPELAMGAIGEDGVRVLDNDLIRRSGVTPAQLQRVEEQERAEMARRSAFFRAGRDRTSLTGRTVVVVDDGIATGATARAACQVARAHGATRVVLAVPVAPVGWTEEFADVADELVCVQTPDPFFAVGRFYVDFDQISDGDVVACLDRVAQHRVDDRIGVDEEVEIRIGGVRLEGHLTVPEGAVGVVVFAHGSGSSRHSPRNRAVAESFGEAGIGTLLFDLLTAEEEADRSKVFDIELLAERLTQATEWLRQRRGAVGLPIGYFGASTGAGAALWAASVPDPGIAAIVSRGGRVDLADARADALTVPTMLIVGSRDVTVLELNQRTRARLHCESELVVVPGASHLFEEHGTLVIVANEARRWFLDHFESAVAPAGSARTG